ncbi:MAG: hypothetical protein JW747_03290 [Candidatus Aminicenantes bacterium]|nr:hypothetical protein [Candidatus Aminicenantes bacterium]
MDHNNPELWKPALLAGVMAGVLAGLPLVNCCCCLWPIAGGLLAVYLHQKQTRAALTGADGAILGALAGLASAVVRTVILIPLQSVNLRFMQKHVFPYLMDLFEQSGQPPPPQLEELIRGELPSLTPQAFFLDLLLTAALFAGLGALGGVIAVSMFKKKTPVRPENPHAAQDPSDRQP